MSAIRRASRSARDTGVHAPSDANGSAHAQIADLQRARILSAMFDVVTERGVANMSVAHVVERSGVSRRTFYELFEDREDCFLVAFEEAVAYASERVLPAYWSQDRWRERIRAGLVAFLSFLDEQPVIGRLLIGESLGGGPGTLERRGQVLARVTSAIDEGRKEIKTSTAPAPLAAEGVVGGALSVIGVRLIDESHVPLVELTGPLMSMIVLPYLGSAAARRELERPVQAPTPCNQGTALLVDPFKDAGLRLTYRTVRVLMAIADSPQASNRTIGDTAGVTDQGQISKLLMRLARGGLVSNTGLGPGQGAPNAWSLTPVGRQVVQTIRAHTESFE
jgi:AcrR family transcriptional regulator/DNA-binding MarR family transcriptional regulator